MASIPGDEATYFRKTFLCHSFTYYASFLCFFVFIGPLFNVGLSNVRSSKGPTGGCMLEIPLFVLFESQSPSFIQVLKAAGCILVYPEGPENMAKR